MYVSMCTQRFHKHEIMLLLRNQVMLVNKAGMMFEIYVQTFAKKFQLLAFMIIILFSAATKCIQW